MTEKLIFPIGFDLESGIKAAEGKADNLLRQLEHRMNQRPIQVRVEMDGSKFAMFSRQFSNNIDGISNKLSQANRLWNEMRFDVKFDAGGNLSRRAEVVFNAFKQLIAASETMGQRLNQVNRQLQQSEAETTRLITAEYDKKQKLIKEQIQDRERQAVAEERVRQSQLKGVNIGYIDLQKQTEAVKNLRLQYEAILPTLNAMAQKRVEIKVGIDKQFEAEINRINAEIARLRHHNLQLGAAGDTSAIQANLTAIRQLETELQRISQQKIDLLNANKINSDISNLRSEVTAVFGELQTAERRLTSDTSLNSALDVQSQKVLNLHANIQKLDQQIAQLNAKGQMYNTDDTFSIQAIALLQQRIALTKQLEQEAITGQQAQIKLEQQLREEKRQTEQTAKQAAKEAEQQAKSEAKARKQAQDAANAENKARQEAYNARRRQGMEIQRILQKESNSIADITAKLQIQQKRLESANLGSAKFTKIASEVKRLTAELENANKKMRELTGQTEIGAIRQKTAVSQVTNEYNRQDGYISRLIKRLAVYAGFSQISNFLTNVRQVTAEFELQRVSLGAILQDQAKANTLFSEIKQFAVKSPVSILDLTKYTKQLAAYKIGYDELFETTKKLTDVSAGLGVAMDRVVLAYGQTRATGHLRASEIRQFTEMGIPIVEELAAKLSKMNGEMVTAAQVMDIVSKRGVSFEMVKEVFDDMTSSGGIFYNMQEKQGNTLYGMWAKLGDAASVMYDQIGNTESINKGMKQGIQMLTDLMRNWQSVGRGIAAAGIAFVTIKAQMKMAAVSSSEVGIKTAQYRMELQRLQQQYLSTSGAARFMTLGQIGFVRIQGMATTATLAFGNALRTMKTVLVSTGWGALALAIGYVIEKLFFAKSTADKLHESLENIYKETSVEQEKSARNFKYLADIATDATKGYKERKDALDELQRTYKNILPQEVLELEYLSKLRGNYDSLTNSIRAYVAEQQRRKAIDTISEEYGNTKLKYERKLTDYFRGEGWSEQEIARFWEQFYKSAADKSKTLEQVVAEAATKGGHDGYETTLKLLKGQNSWTKDLDKKSYSFIGLTVLGSVDFIDLLRDAVLEENQALEQNEERTKAAKESTSAFAEAQAKMAERIDKMKFVGASGEEVDRDSFLGGQMLKNAEIKGLSEILKTEFENAGMVWEERFGNFVNKVNASKPELISSLDFTAIIDTLVQQLNRNDLTDAQREMLTNLLTTTRQAQQKYWEIIPSDPLVRTWQHRFKAIANTVAEFKTQYNKYLMQSGEDLETYNKRLKDSLEGLKNRVKGLLATQKLVVRAGVFAKILYGVSADELQEAIDNTNKEIAIIEKVLAEQPNYDKNKSNGSKKSDPRLQTLQEIANKMAEVNKEYDELLKKEGQTKALADTQKLFASSFKQMQETAKKYNFKLPTFEVPQTIEDVQKWYQAIQKEIKRLGLKNADKVLIELGFKSDKAAIDKAQKDIEKQLKSLADRISRTKTAKEFYEKILAQTGDVELAAHVTLSLYGDTGEGLFDATVEQIKAIFKSNDPNVKIDLSSVIDTTNKRINYGALAKLYQQYQHVISEANQKTAEDIIKNGQKAAEKQIETWEKELAKAKDYEAQRTEVIRRESQRRAEIIKNSEYTPEEKKARLKLSRDKEAQEISDINLKEFKESDFYIQMFEDLENKATSSLKLLRTEIQRIIDTDKKLSPENMKAMVDALEKIDEEIDGRNPVALMKDGMLGMFTAIKKLKTARDELGKAEAEYAAQQPQLDADVKAAKEENDADKSDVEEKEAKLRAIRQQIAELEKQEFKDETALVLLKEQEVAADKALVAAMLKQEQSAGKLTEATTKRTNAEKKLRKKKKEQADAENEVVDAQNKFIKGVNTAREVTEKVKTILEELEPLFGDLTSDATALGDVFTAMVSAMSTFTSIMELAIILQEAFNIATESNPWMAIAAAVLAVTAAFAGFLSSKKVRKANKEIERQKDLLDRLEYTYSRLTKAMEKAFGADYISNYHTQLSVMNAKAEAYRKQAEAERSKGKKTDKDKLKEYENSYRDTMDEIADMQGQIATQMLGTDLTSAARDFAQAWLDAYKEFSNTSDALSDKFKEMIENMVVEGAMAKVMERALNPMFDMIDNMDESDFYSESFWKNVVAKAEQGAKDADYGAQTMMHFLEQAGISMRDLGSELSGISRETANATSEEINANTAALNTQNYYMQQINENVRLISANMRMDMPSYDYTSLISESVDRLSMIERHTSEILTECRRSAMACEDMNAKFGRVIGIRGNSSGVRVI